MEVVRTAACRTGGRTGVGGVLVLFILGGSLVGWAQQETPRPWTVEDILFQESAAQFDLSPDGKWAVWVKRVADKEKNGRIPNLFLTNLQDLSEIQLTRGRDEHSSPQWSPDGRYLAFLSDRPAGGGEKDSPEGEEGKKRTQLWLMHPFGGEPWALTRLKRSIRSFEWAGPDSIIFAAQEDPTLQEKKREEEKDTSRVVEDPQWEPPVRLFRVGIDSGRIERLTVNRDWIEDFALSPDGRYAVAIHQQSLSYTYDQRIKPRYFLHDLQSGTSRELFAEGQVYPVAIRWAWNGQGFYVSSAYSTHPIFRMAVIQQLYYYDLAAAQVRPVDLDWERGLRNFAVSREGCVVSLADGVRPRLAHYRLGPGGTWTRTWLEGEHGRNIFQLVTGRDGMTLLYEFSTASSPPQWYAARLQEGRLSEPRRITRLNRHLEPLPKARTEILRWNGSGGDEIEGVLFYPHDYQEGKTYPLIVIIHGGPNAADYDAWDESVVRPHNLFSQRSAFVLKPNYHGSSDYGLEFGESISGGKYYELEVPDIEAGVDELIRQGKVDPQKLGVMGWSNGAILAIALTVHSDRYRAASAGAGDVEWVSDWGNCSFGAAFDEYYLGASPLENPQIYLEKSPFFQMDRVKTPTLIHFGTEDRAVPTQQGWMHFRALQQLGKTEVKFILYPGEEHELKKLSHRRRKLEEDLYWFDRHLFQRETEAEPFRPGSPLDVVLQLQQSRLPDGRFGRMVQDTLVPEVVPYGKLRVGRFEVTRAQYAFFDPDYPVRPGEENLPASGIPFERAQEYCRWLSGRTGESYRLGTEEEMLPLYNVANGRENTLDYWAGHAVNPDDARRLQAVLDRLPHPESLLRPVGSFEPLGPETLIFDVGGNVAEWVVGQDGGGKLLGGSADRPSDPKRRPVDAGPAYRGFRVLQQAGEQGH